MKTFKIHWLILCSLILSGGIWLLLWYRCAYPQEVTNLINMSLAVIATFSSFVAIMIADQRLPKIRTKLGVWSPSNKAIHDDDGDKQVVVFKLTNESKQVIDDLVILMNIPNELNLHFGGTNKTSTADFHEQAATKILRFKQFEYLDSEGEHANLEIRLGLQLDNWSGSRVIYLSVLGHKMGSQRFKISKSAIEGIKKANSAKPYYFSPIK